MVPAGCSYFVRFVSMPRVRDWTHHNSSYAVLRRPGELALTEAAEEVGMMVTTPSRGVKEAVDWVVDSRTP